ncbi:MAG: inositol monophosphatase [Chloroflexi bacterium]|nr:inositol monophosphatase [Chloroflexota bacterium]
MSHANLPVQRDDVIAITRQAGQLTVELQQQGLRAIRTKANAYDLVTEADVASEKLLREKLTALDPAIGFWGEESNQPPYSELYWLVDPIDGTTNYASGVPWWAVNVTLYQRTDALLAVTLHLPYGEIFWAEVGGGAWRGWADGRVEQMRVNGAESLGAGILGTGFPYSRGDGTDDNRAEHNRLLPLCRDIRRMGSAAIDLAHVAAGIFSAFWEVTLNPWDVGAGLLLVHEAGGIVTDYAGNPYAFGADGLVASNGRAGVHGALLTNIRAARGERISPSKADADQSD